MKYHVILALAAGVMLFAGCQTKEDVTPVGAKTITLKAQKPVMTKVTMTQDDPDAFYMGLSSEWEEDDKILVFDAEGNATEFSIASIDADGVATFTGTPATEIAVGDPITAVVLNEAVEAEYYNKDSKSIPAYLVYQAGTLENAVDNTLMYAEGTYSESGVSLEFETKTSIIEFKLSLPETATDVTSVCKWYLSSGSTASKTLTNQTDIVVAGENKGAVTNSIYKNQSGSTIYDISNTSATYPVADNVVTLYISVTPENLQNTIIQCQPSMTAEERFVWRVAGASSPLTIEGGNAYTVTRTSPKFALSGSHIKDDAEYNQVFNLPSSCLTGVTIEKTVASDWLDVTATESTITVAAAENTSGSPRQNTVTFDIYGYKYNYSYTQIEAKDLAGDWNMLTFKLFAGTISADNKYVSAAKNQPSNDNYAIVDASASSYYAQTVKMAKLDGESAITAKTKSGAIWNTTSHTNNVTLEGLSDPGLLVKAEFKKSETQATLGLFMMQPFVTAEQIATPQHFSASGFDQYYAWLMPELFGSNFALTFGTLGSDSFYWLEGRISVIGNTTSIYWDLSNSKRPVLSTSTSYKVAGLMVNPFNASGTNIGQAGGPSASTLIRNVSGTAATGSSSVNAAWQYVYQGSFKMTKNTSSVSAEGISAAAYVEK